MNRNSYSNPFRNSYSRFSDEEEEDEEEEEWEEEIIVTARRLAPFAGPLGSFGGGPSFQGKSPQSPREEDPPQDCNIERNNQGGASSDGSESLEDNKGANPTGKGIRNDRQGKGHYGASRGDDTHEGVDLMATVGQDVVAPYDGKVTAVGSPYGANESYESIWIETSSSIGLRIKIFYVDASDALTTKVRAAARGEGAAPTVKKNEVIGTAQDIASKYNITDPNHKDFMPIEDRMDNHVHVETYKQDDTQKKYVLEDPNEHINTTPTSAESAQQPQSQDCSLPS